MEETQFIIIIIIIIIIIYGGSAGFQTVGVPSQVLFIHY